MFGFRRECQMCTFGTPTKREHRPEGFVAGTEGYQVQRGIGKYTLYQTFVSSIWKMTQLFAIPGVRKNALISRLFANMREWRAPLSASCHTQGTHTGGRRL